MHQDLLLATKLHIPPIRPELVSRPRLLERLSAGLDRRLTLVSAPAGFGKTTLVSEWVASFSPLEPEVRAAWLSLDGGDNEPARFLAYLIASLRTVEVGLVKGALRALLSPQPPPTEAVLTPLLNEIAAIPDPIVFALDDYHLIEAQPIHDALTFVLEHLPPRVHLVIASREDPHLPLARLRARGQLTEVRATDLRFTSSEAAVYLNQMMGLALSPEDIAALERRTEGWITGLHLAAISIQGHKDVANFIESFTGSHRYVVDYLVAEVLEQQPESVQAFLLQSAILDRLTGPLCNAVTGQDGGQATLEMLERANLFIIPLDDKRLWYRYHHLFSELLLQRLRRTQPDQVGELHIRASVWYEGNGFPEEAIEHALLAKAFDRAACLMEVQADAVWESGDHAKMYKWLARLPAEVVTSRPELTIYRAVELFRCGIQDGAEQNLHVAEKVLNSKVDGTNVASVMRQLMTPDEARTSLLGRVAAIRALMASYRGDSAAILPHARRALEFLPEQQLNWRSTAAICLGDAHFYLGDMKAAYGAQLAALDICTATGNPFLILYTNLLLAITHTQSGRVKQADDICRQLARQVNEGGMGHTAVAGWIASIWGEVLAELNELDAAVRQAEKGLEQTRRGGDVMMLGWSYLSLARVLFSSGDLPATETLVQQARGLGQGAELPGWVQSRLAAWQARAWLALGDRKAAWEWVDERGLDAGREPPPYPREAEYITLARILTAQGQADEATNLLDRLLEAAEAGGRTARVIEILNLQALAFRAGGSTAQAIEALGRALALGEPGGFVCTFVDEGTPMARLLYEAAARGISPEYTARLLAAFPVAEPEPSDPSRPQTRESDLIEPLSERELEVLALLAEGLTNREIASRLFVTVNTVKAHARSIYGKLGVNNRTQAVGRARALGILPPT